MLRRDDRRPFDELQEVEEIAGLQCVRTFGSRAPSAFGRPQCGARDQCGGRDRQWDEIRGRAADLAWSQLFLNHAAPLERESQKPTE